MFKVMEQVLIMKLLDKYLRDILSLMALIVLLLTLALLASCACPELESDGYECKTTEFSTVCKERFICKT